MRLNVIHRTHYAYAPPAQRVALRLRLFPSAFEGQESSNWTVKVNGKNVESLFVDGFGDEHGLWTSNEPCPSVEIVASGEVHTSDKAGVVIGLPRKPPPHVFLRCTDLTASSPKIEELARSLPGKHTLEKLHELSKAVREHLTYTPSTTTADTTAAQALALGKGVCQDHAHVFIAAARRLGIPARYVVGYMVAWDDAAELHETHAWAEAHVDDLGWVGFDPANGLCPSDRYIRVCCGLDAHHAAPVRGSVGGNSTVDLDAYVEITQAQQ